MSTLSNKESLKGNRWFKDWSNPLDLMILHISIDDYFTRENAQKTIERELSKFEEAMKNPEFLEIMNDNHIANHNALKEALPLVKNGDYDKLILEAKKDYVKKHSPKKPLGRPIKGLASQHIRSKDKRYVLQVAEYAIHHNIPLTSTDLIKAMSDPKNFPNSSPMKNSQRMRDIAWLIIGIKACIMKELAEKINQGGK